jgi:hypothetical protein
MKYREQNAVEGRGEVLNAIKTQGIKSVVSKKRNSRF